MKLLPDSGEEVGAVTRHPGSAAVPAGARVVSGNPSRQKTLTSAQSLTRGGKQPAVIGQGAGQSSGLAGSISRLSCADRRPTGRPADATAVRN